MLVTPTEALLREQAASLLGGFPIESLGPEQERLIGVYSDEYFRVGSCTEPSDRPRAEKAITALYRSHGYDPPRFEWGGGPKWGAERSWSLFSEHPIHRVNNYSLCEVFESTMDSLVPNLEPFVVSDLEQWLWGKAWYKLYVSITQSFRDPLVQLLAPDCEFAIEGNLEVSSIVIHVYAHQVLRIPYPNQDLGRLVLLDEIARSTGMWWPFSDVCICTERPAIIDWIPGKIPRLFKAYYRDGLVVTGKR